MAARILKRIRGRVRREATADRPAEVVALERSFSYLHRSIDAASVIPKALSEGLITDRQRSECSGETDAYKQAETLLGHLLRAVNGNQKHFNIFLQVLEESGHGSAAAHLLLRITLSLGTRLFR